MKNLHKLLIVFISIVMISSSAFAQREQQANKPNMGIAPAGSFTQSYLNNATLLRGNTAYANMVVDTSFHPFVSFDTDQPETLNEINASPGWLSFAGDFDNVNTNFYYIINYQTGALQTIEVATGNILSTVGYPAFAGDFVTGMACDKITGIMYVCAAEPNTMAYSSIWTLNLETAVATLVGQTTPDEVIIDIAIDATGDMYGVGILNDEGLLINKTTAEATVLGPLGYNANNGQGMAYDPQEDIIYIAAFNESGAGGELHTFDRVSGTSALVGVFPDGVQIDAFGFPGVPETYETDLGVVTIVSPTSGVNLTADEPVTVRFRNYGTTDHSDIEISYTFQGGAAFSETLPSLAAGEIVDYTFATTVDLSEYGPYEIVACILLEDENPDNNCKTKVLTNLVPELCFPDYNTGCDWGDGFVDFAVEEIQNYGTFCENNTGLSGYSQYLELGPATLIPGNTHTFKVTGGYATQVLNIWIDFNDNLLFDLDEMILADFMIAEANVLTDIDVTMPAGATPGLHYMRAMIVWNQYFTESCQHYDMGECEDYMVNIDDPQSVFDFNSTAVMISPNPANDQLMVNAGQAINAYSIMDVNGRTLESNVVESSNFSINVSQYNSGVYFLRLETDDKLIMQKIIIN